MEGDGRAVAYAGGWSDYRTQRERSPAPGPSAPAEISRPRLAPEKPPASPARVSFAQTHRLQTLPDEIARLEAEIGRLETFLADQDLYVQAPEKFARASEALVSRQRALAIAEEEWLVLEELREAADQDLR
jgi:ATP-binding cassette subfamily F protein uup